MIDQNKNSRKARGRTADFGEDQSSGGPKHTLSNRSFGFVFSGVFGVWALLNYFFGDGDFVQSLIIAGVISGSVAVVIPAALAPFNRGWAKVAGVLSRMVSGVVMGAVFFLVVTPVAVVMRRFRKEDPLRLRPDTDAETYWIPSDQPPDGKSNMEHQY
ncbi:MAG: hypothetical protein HOB82_07890 [Alphaproteobacteria bacterium]|jgi:hypothetical protein|nr:hypothetical protein [Alphaproteobacteria bacterium]MBT4711432.1 hypothetical protein [Alphaproteobacteria bacterium]MBT5859648.1 hypothetical protein [Alphaproteobacteria bacterium]